MISLFTLRNSICVANIILIASLPLPSITLKTTLLLLTKHFSKSKLQELMNHYIRTTLRFWNLYLATNLLTYSRPQVSLYCKTSQIFYDHLPLIFFNCTYWKCCTRKFLILSTPCLYYQSLRNVLASSFHHHHHLIPPRLPNFQSQLASCLSPLHHSALHMTQSLQHSRTISATVKPTLEYTLKFKTLIVLRETYIFAANDR